MTRLLDLAIEAASQLSPEEQDELARTILEIVGGSSSPYILSADENEAIDRGLAELDSGSSAGMAELRTTLAKYRT